MKFTFYLGEKKKKTKVNVIKAETKEELLLVAKVAKCELTKNSILKDLDFSNSKLMCTVKDKELTMKELWNFLNKKLQIEDKIKKEKSSKKKDKKKKKSKKSKSSKKKSKETNTQTIKKSNDGLIHITRR